MLSVLLSFVQGAPGQGGMPGPPGPQGTAVSDLAANKLTEQSLHTWSAIRSSIH